MRAMLAICGFVILLGNGVRAARLLKIDSGSANGLRASLVGQLMQHASGRGLRQVGNTGWSSDTFHQPRDYRLINQLPFDAHVMQGSMMAASGYRGGASAASSFDSALYYGGGYGSGYGGFNGGGVFGYDPYGQYGVAGLRNPYDAAFLASRSNAIYTRLRSSKPYDVD